MNHSQRKNTCFLVGGIVLSVVMCAGLVKSFSAVPDGSSPAKLAQAIGIWAAGTALGSVIFFVGLGRLIFRWLQDRRCERSV